MLRYLRLLRAFAATELQFELEYRTNLVVELLQMVVVIVTSLGAALVLFNYTTQLNGWTLGEMLVLLGVFYVVQGVEETIFQPSFTTFMEHVRQGTLDFILLKPVSAQFFVSVRRMQLIQTAQATLGVAIVVVGITRLELVTPWTAVAFALALACGVALVYALLLGLSTLAFWFVRVDNILAIFWSFLDAARFPIDIYPGWLRLTLSTVVPIGIAVTVPAQALAGRLDLTGLALLGVAAVAAMAVSAWLWRLGLRSYTGASA
ncbi:MAG TPA: ABC-2 family transporter protein [Candidatus Dormibacteraeota bacterium]|nr:ABC-2 family transporter protein [Candidatus Dormibacteraeota bacterium]